MNLDRALLEIERIAGSGSVIRDPDIRAAYSHDESEVEPHLADAIVRVERGDVLALVVEIAAKYEIPLTARGAGTGRVGGAVPVHGGIVLSTEKLNSIVEIDAQEGIAIVDPGVVLADLHAAVEAEGLFYPPDPNSLATCTIGGNLACNAGGPRAFKYGVTRNYVLSLQAVTGSGARLNVGRPTVKGVTGYDLAGLIVGSEGTLALIERARLRLIPRPESIHTLLVFLPSDESIGEAIQATLRRGITPRCLELIDSIALGLMRRDAGVAIPEGAEAMLLVELDGDEALLERELERVADAFNAAGALEILSAQSSTERERLWAARRELSRTLRGIARFKLSEDIVVPRRRIFDLLRRCREISEESGILMPTYGHAGDGNLHVNFLWDDPEKRPEVDRAIEALFRATVEMGGTLSGEHGIGVLKAPYLPLEQSSELITLQRGIKALFDPSGILNPGKIFLTERKGHGTC
ncbi:MAG: FAD-binding protein [Sandaracinaceae bacterium]|nr:FAD-binding protein [Sandaracinaceae bacterium]